MIIMWIKRLLFFIFLTPLFYTVEASRLPLKITEVVSKNQIVEWNNQGLILLDFWATWCGPCHPATMQLEILQERLKDEIFMLAVSDEMSDVVENYLRRKPIRLMVVRDDDAKLFREFKVNRRPYSVLLDTEGRVLWEGHPAELTYEKARKFANSVKRVKEYSFVDLFREYKSPPANLDVETKHQSLASTLRIMRTTGQGTGFQEEEDVISYQGSFFKLIAKIYNTSPQCVTSSIFEDFNVSFQSPLELWELRRDSILSLLSNQLHITIVPKVEMKHVYIFHVLDKGKLWDDQQIALGTENKSNYLLGNDRIQADNMSIGDFCILLSEIKHTVYRYAGDDMKPYDWDVHIRYDNLMIDELLTQFGIETEKQHMEITSFAIE